MNLSSFKSSSLRFSTRELPPSKQQEALCELFDRSIQMDIDAEPGQTIDMEINLTPGLRRARMLSSLTARVTRSPARLVDDEDTMCLMIKTGGKMALRQGRQEAIARTGDAVLLVYRQPALLDFQKCTYLSVRVPFSSVAPIAKMEGAAGRWIPRETGALSLLRNYIASLPPCIEDPQLAHLTATHIHDLIAVAIGPNKEGRELANQRGLRAARLRSIQTAAMENPTWQIEQVAASQGISARYVQMLFEEQGTTFSDFVLERRLDLTRHMLTSPRYAHWSIVAIALEAGFGDLSHFNRHFKRRYSMTPRELRATNPLSSAKVT